MGDLFSAFPMRDLKSALGFTLGVIVVMLVLKKTGIASKIGV